MCEQLLIREMGICKVLGFDTVEVFLVDRAEVKPLAVMRERNAVHIGDERLTVLIDHVALINVQYIA
jgi:hypothetical protein